ncbi:neck protein [uncultured Caudovirales phage]|uniref:Neck protein n=1 Tax=uncultured Caudovirales phage TaxID=2100421 RepID=A0A6J5KZ47_9CAUD|nr:neck protein [uncultured Caudovirales phage]
MARNIYFGQGSKNEQFLLEDLIIESISIWGQDFYYIPRTLIAKDEILGEDRLSEFKTAYPVEMYLETVDGFEGQGAFIQKFGLMMEQSATLTLARRRWEQLVGRFGEAQLPNRPCEGDLLYFPLSGGMFEIKFVQHQDPFYQLGKLYVYKLNIELFQYSSERITTGVPEIDVFETLKTFDTTKQPDIDVPDSFGDNNKFKEEKVGVVFNANNPFGDV